MIKTITQIQILIICLFLHSNLSAQFSVSKRETTILENNRDDDFLLFSLKEKGLLLIKADEPWKYAPKKQWIIILKDKNLNTVFETERSLPYVFTKEQFYFYDEKQNFYFLAEDEGKKNFYVLKVDIEKKELSYFQGSPPVKFIFQDFIALDNHIFLVGSSNNKQVVLDFSLLDSKITVMPSFYNDEEDIESFHIDKKYNSLYFSITNRQGKFCSMYIKPYSNLLGFAPNHLIQKGKYKKESPKWSYTYSKDSQNRLIFGIYSLDCARYAQGLFVSSFENSEEKKIRYYKFVDMRNFFEHLGEKRAEKMREKVKVRRQKGKDLLVSNYTLPNISVNKRNGEIIMSFEGYTSTNNNPNNNTYNSIYARSLQVRRYPYYGMPLPNNSLSKSIQRYNYGLVCAFDTNGRLTWNNTMNLDAIQDTEFRTHMEVGFLEDSTVLAYLDDKSIYSKMVHKKRTIKEIKEQEIVDLTPDEKVELIGEDNFFHWYDNHYILWGIERSRGKVLYNPKFFHITKLSYYPEPEEEEEDNKEKKKKNKKEKEKK